MKKQHSNSEEFYKKAAKEMIDKLSENEAIFFYRLIANILTAQKESH